MQLTERMKSGMRDETVIYGSTLASGSLSPTFFGATLGNQESAVVTPSSVRIRDHVVFSYHSKYASVCRKIPLS
jgi:hypothetical protein